MFHFEDPVCYLNVKLSSTRTAEVQEPSGIFKLTNIIKENIAQFKIHNPI